MSGYVCLKPLTFSGVQYLPGNPIPADVVLPSRVNALKQMGFLAEQDEAHLLAAVVDTRTAPDTVFTIPVAAEGDAMEGVPASEGSVVTAASILQMTVEQAGEAIKDTTDETALTLIRALDSRKGVKSAAAKLEELRGGDA